ncbi:hypothetical protein [Larkinella terrae]|uniref:Uncharacterized protein n=1 Tax=Larkinella terrae TaxID=2025311 RepID=A0A7K0ENM7_9BACT|nr:hypothetical protein [Larkinella terrae]MRS63322.1 hypothetical protein [Larkinella terrae]
MFDLNKDIDKYKGIPPYASEHYGVYQPLLGWTSKLSTQWVRNGGTIVDSRIKQILDGRITPGPLEVKNASDPREWMVTPLGIGQSTSPYKVFITKDLDSVLLKLVLIPLQTYVNSNGKLPLGDKWAQVVGKDIIMHPQNGLLLQANNIHRSRLYQEMIAQSAGQPITDQMRISVSAKHLKLMQYESQIATFLLFCLESQENLSPSELNQLFSVQVAPPLSDLFRSTDPLSTIDPNDKSGSLSPVGFVHLFRQYFFDLGTFLGEPVEHVWLAPGTSIELIEVSTRKTIVERTQEQFQEMTTRTEQSTEVKDELSDAVKTENSRSTKLGITTTQSITYPVYQGTATASFGTETTRKDARETSHKQNREQAEKLSSEIKQSFKSVFKTTTEITDTRSRRYLLQNQTGNLINYELRRKMRRVGVQMQDLGTRLCWQVFIDDAGAKLGLAELVHFAESPDLADLKQPEIGPPPANIVKKVTLPIPFSPILNYSNWKANYEYWHQDLSGNYAGKHIGLIKGDDNDDDSNIIMGPFNFKFDPPQSNYELTDDIRILGPQNNKQCIVKEVKRKTDGSFDLILQFVNFGSENSLNLDVELVFKPQSTAFTDYVANKKVAQAKYDAEKSQLIRKSFLENVRERIKDARSIKERPSWDLREEERTIIYRNLIQKLMLDSWAIATNNPKDEANSRLSHVRSEIIRAIFDVDGMLYFVAPEWWMPRRHASQFNPGVNVGDATINLTDNDVVKWDDIETRPDNYKITEDSPTAKLGSSLGWLLQLDGDNLRNAFLNAPWVKAVIPIRPGREKAALNWLRTIEGHENDGWDSPYLGNADEDAEFIGKTVGEVLEIVADRMEKENGSIKSVLETDKVFETGFNYLAGGFDAGLPANQVFSQWISILPTDQIVAADYKPTDLEI